MLGENSGIDSLLNQLLTILLEHEGIIFKEVQMKFCASCGSMGSLQFRSPEARKAYELACAIQRRKNGQGKD